LKSDSQACNLQFHISAVGKKVAGLIVKICRGIKPLHITKSGGAKTFFWGGWVYCQPPSKISRVLSPPSPPVICTNGWE